MQPHKTTSTALSSALRKVADYEKVFRNLDPLKERPAPFSVEPTFDNFVQRFGGAKISDLLPSKAQMPLNADYLFRDHNVIAELKTIEGVYSGETGVRAFRQAFIDAGYLSDFELGGVLWRGDPIPPKVSALITRRMRRSLEQRIKKSRSQLRTSKSFFGNSETRTLIMIAMDQPPIFGHRLVLLSLAKVMSDNYADEHTDGVIYLNPNVPTKVFAEGMEFSGWFPFYRDDNVNAELSAFVNLLGSRWLNYVGSLTGQTNPILDLETPEDIMAVLGNG